jgi:hypothetical protein
MAVPNAYPVDFMGLIEIRLAKGGIPGRILPVDSHSASRLASESRNLHLPAWPGPATSGAH